jgi:hypothetical protein
LFSFYSQAWVLGLHWVWFHENLNPALNRRSR